MISGERGMQWLTFEESFPGLEVEQPTVADLVLWVDGRPWGRIEQFYKGHMAYANDVRGRLGAFETVDQAMQAIEARVLRCVHNREWQQCA